MQSPLHPAHAAVFEHTPDGVLVFDLQHRLVEANAAARQLFGESALWPGRSVAELLPGWMPPEPLASSGPASEQALLWHGPAGAPRGAHSLRIRSIPLPEGRVVLLRDLTEHAELEATLLRQKEYYESVLHHSPVAIITVNLQFTVVSWNPAAERLFGHTAKEAIGRSILQLLAGDTGPLREEAEYTAREALERGQVHAFTRRLRKDGTPIDVELLALPVTVEGEHLGFIAIYHDISELKRLHEREVAHLRTIEHERERVDELLLSILPRPVAERLKQGQRIIVENFEDVTVLFADLVDFTRFSAQHSAADVLQVLNMAFSEFDRLTEEHGVEKVKTIGDAYMAVGGLSVPRRDHAEAMADLALAMREEMRRLGEQLQIPLHLRIGLHSGPVIAGVIGGKKFAYDMWGDTVNTASRMESHGVVDGIHLTEAVHARLGERFRVQPQGLVNVKGKGPMPTFLLLGTR
jgi:adenylate cyclase